MQTDVTPQQTYRVRTKLVRGSALDHLRQLRADRLARRLPGVKTAQPTVEPPADDRAPDLPVLAISRATADLLAAHDAAAVELPPVVPDAPPATLALQAPEASTTGEEQRADAGTVPDVEPDAMTAAAEVADLAPRSPNQSGTLVAEVATEEPEPATQLAQAGEADPQPMTGPTDTAGNSPMPATAPAAAIMAGGTGPASPPPQDDLTLLPGAGVGLIWMLGQCGIHSLSDLAAADADTLAANLGLVGKLIDLTAWITFARQMPAPLHDAAA